VYRFLPPLYRFQKFNFMDMPQAEFLGILNFYNSTISISVIAFFYTVSSTTEIEIVELTVYKSAITDVEIVELTVY
jgi:hypothetical protein